MLQEEDQKPPAITTRADEIFKELGLYPKENAFHKTEEYKYVCREPDVVMACYNALKLKFPELVPTFSKYNCVL